MGRASLGQQSRGPAEWGSRDQRLLARVGRLLARCRLFLAPDRPSQDESAERIFVRRVEVIRDQRRGDAAAQQTDDHAERGEVADMDHMSARILVPTKARITAIVLSR